MRFGSNTIGPFYVDTRVGDRLKYYASFKNRSVQEVVVDAITAYIDADNSEATRVDSVLAVQYSGDHLPPKRTLRDVRREESVQVTAEDKFTGTTLWHPNDGTAPPWQKDGQG